MEEIDGVRPPQIQARRVGERGPVGNDARLVGRDNISSPGMAAPRVFPVPRVFRF